MAREKIGIIIPAYNEEKRIGKTLEAYGNFFNSLKRKKLLDYEILIVINNTKDKTEDIVRAYKKKNRNIRYLNFRQGGKGFAIIEGFKDALKRKNDLIGFVDADMATSPQAFYDLVKNIGNYDGIIASRYVSGAVIHPKQSLQRIAASRIFNFLVRILFLLPYKDTQCGAKIFRQKALKTMLPELGVTQWAFDVDLLYRARQNRLKIKEFPTVWSDKTFSKLDVKKTSIQMFLAVARLRLVNSPFKIFARPLKFLVKPIWKLVK